MKALLPQKAILTASAILLSSLASSTAQGPLSASQPMGAQIKDQYTEKEIRELIDDAGRQTTAMTVRVGDYTYIREDVERIFDARSGLKQESIKVYEGYPSPGRLSVLVQLSENGAPLSSKRIERERSRATRELIEAERRANRPPDRESLHNSRLSHEQAWRSYGISRSIDGFYLRPTAFLSHVFLAARRTLFNSRETVVMNFHPRPDAIARNETLRVLGKLAGRIWIDAQDKVIVRLEAFPIKETGNEWSVATSVRSNAPVVFELDRLPDGTWAPSLMHVNTYGREATFEGARMNRTVEYRDFKLFATKVINADVVPPQEPL